MSLVVARGTEYSEWRSHDVHWDTIFFLSSPPRLVDMAAATPITLFPGRLACGKACETSVVNVGIAFLGSF
jgi:hypothetical protein